MEGNKQRQVAFWKRLQALREGQLPMKDGWNGDEREALLRRIEERHIKEVRARSYDYVLPSKQGLVIYHPLFPSAPTIPYPEPVKVSDPPSLIRSRIRILTQILRKETELTYNIMLALDRIRDAQMKQLLAANYNKGLAQMDRTWRAIKVEIAALTGLPTARLGE